MNRDTFLDRYHGERFYFTAKSEQEKREFITRMQCWNIKWVTGTPLSLEMDVVRLNPERGMDISKFHTEEHSFRHGSRDWYKNNGYVHVPVSEILAPTIEVSLYD